MNISQKLLEIRQKYEDSTFLGNLEKQTLEEIWKGTRILDIVNSEFL